MRLRTVHRIGTGIGLCLVVLFVPQPALAMPPNVQQILGRAPYHVKVKIDHVQDAGETRCTIHGTVAQNVFDNPNRKAMDQNLAVQFTLFCPKPHEAPPTCTFALKYADLHGAKFVEVLLAEPSESEIRSHQYHVPMGWARLDEDPQ